MTTIGVSLLFGDDPEFLTRPIVGLPKGVKSVRRVVAKEDWMFLVLKTSKHGKQLWFAGPGKGKGIRPVYRAIQLSEGEIRIEQDVNTTANANYDSLPDLKK